MLSRLHWIVRHDDPCMVFANGSGIPGPRLSRRAGSPKSGDAAWTFATAGRTNLASDLRKRCELMKHTILFLAADPRDTDPLALQEECAAIEQALRRSTVATSTSARGEP